MSNHKDLTDKTALKNAVGTREMLDKAESFDHIIAVYECANNAELRKLAIKKLDSKIDEWFEYNDDEHLAYIASNAPIGSETRKRAEQLHSARLGHL
ncbi:hypothetical protein KC851_04280 [Candidatus Kaiserbacteria bacterium]|nr:hypothetical protein [Candidatus Kaiserbacteria bacterium]